jgi:hypothetical protein
MRDRATLSNHNLDVIAQVAPRLLEAGTTLGNGTLHRFTPDIGGSYVAQIHEFFLVTHIVVEGGVGQAQHVGDVFQ